MIYKNEFIQPADIPEAHREANLKHRKQNSGALLGTMMADDFGHTTEYRGELIHKLEIVAFPIEDWHAFINKLKQEVPAEYHQAVKEVINNLEKQYPKP